MRIRLIACAALLVVLVLGAAVWSPVGATNLTGTFKHPDGTSVNGKLVFLLSQPARLNDGSAQVVPMVKIFSVTNGQLEAGAFIYGNDVLLPSGTYYLVRLVDNSNNLLFEQKWSIQGTDLDLGTLTPTTTGVVVPDPLLKNIPTDQAVEGPVTFTSPVTAFTLTLNGNLNPGSAQSYDLGSPTMPWRGMYVDALRPKGSPWFDVQAYGAVGDNLTNDTAAFQAAITACVNQGSGTVYVPVQTAGTVYRVPGPLTFTSPTSGWCRMLIHGDIILADVNGNNGNGWSIPSRWIIEGLGNKTFTHGTWGYDPQASINGGTSGTYDIITVTSGPVVIRGIKVQNVLQHGINISPTSSVSNFKIENVTVGKTGSTAGSPLRIANTQWVVVRDSSFIQSGTSTSPSIEITSTALNLSIFHFENVTTAGRTIKLTGTPANLEAGAMIFENMVYENGNDEGMFTIDTKPGANGIAWRGLSFLDAQCADIQLAGGCALLKSAPTNDGGLIEGVVVRNPGYFAQGIFKPDPTKGPQEIQGLVVEGIQNSSGAMPIGQHDQYLAVLKNQTRSGTAYVDEMFKMLMQRPANVVATPSASGGSLGDGAYYIVVTALDADGKETYISEEKSATVSGSGGAGKIDITWNAVPGTVSYRIYGPSGTAGGGQAAYYSTQNKPRFGTSSTNSFTYSAALSNVGNPPTFLTDAGNAATIKMLSSGAAWFAGQIESKVATGTAPFIAASTTEVANLNTQRWHGKEALDFSASLDFGSIAAQSCSELTITVTGASANNAVAASWPVSLETGLAGLMRVSASGSVAVRLCNITAAAIDPAAQTFAGRVIQ